MKRYLLTGGFAAALLLGACSGEEAGDTESTEEESTEEVTEEETTEETTEDAEASADEEEIEQAKAEGADEVAEEVETDTAEEVEQGDHIIKTTEVNETLELDTVNLNIVGGIISHLSPNEMEAPLIMKEDVQAGQELDVFSVQYNMENTTDEPRTLFIDQAQIVTSTGEQIEPEMLISEGLTTDMQGAVSSTGVVLYILNEGTGEDVEWVDIIIPAVSDESFMPLSEEQKYRIEF